MAKQVVFFGEQGVVSIPQKDGFVVMPYAGEKVETPLFKGYRVANLHPLGYALYHIYEVKTMDRLTTLVNRIEGLNISPTITPDMAFTVVPIETDMLEDALSWGAVGFGVMKQRNGSIELVALFREETREGDDFAEFFSLPVDFLYPPQFMSLFRGLEAGDLDFYLMDYDRAFALYDGNRWLLYRGFSEPETL